MGQTKIILMLTMALLVMNCRHDHDDLEDPVENRYEFLPENLIATNDDGTITARYVDPTTRYDHGILGDKIEAGGLLVVINNKEYYYGLAKEFVFEDLRPRLKDIDHDGDIEFITIQTRLDSGASVSVYKIMNGTLKPFVRSNYIGTPYRWLNIAAIDDLDNDGNVEIAWIQTPHIGGVLRIARIANDTLRVLDEKEGVSNHQIGSRNLCLSVVTASKDGKLLYVPDNHHDAMIAFSFKNQQFFAEDTVFLNIDPTLPLFMQYDFQNISEDKNCIYIPGK